MNAIAEQRFKMFNDAKSVLWKREELKALAEKYGYSLKRFNDICRAYAENILGFNRGDYGNFKKCYKHFVLFHLNTYELYIYYDKFASSQEKEEFHQKIKAFFIKIIQEFKSPNFDKQIWLQENNLTDCDLYKVVSIFGSLYPTVVNVVYNTFKFYYDYAESVNFEKTAILAKANELGITYQYFISLINAYGWHILKMKDDFINKRRSPRGRYVDVLDEIRVSDNPDEIHKLFILNNIKKGHIIEYVYIHNKDLSRQQQLQLEKQLLQKYAIYLEMAKKQNNKKTNTLDRFVKEYFNSNKTLDDFCEDNDIKRESFLKLLSKMPDSDFKSLVRERIRKEPPVSIEYKNEDDFRMLALYIRSGITVDNETREFDLIDFFMLFPNLNPLINFHKMDIDPLDKTNISLLLDPMKFASYINKTSIMKGSITIGGVTLKEKELSLIIRFLEDNNVPLYDRVFMIACKRYINHTLDVSYLQAELV